MNKFAFAQATSLAEAASVLADKKHPLPVLKAGGIDLIDHLKEGLTEPDIVVNIRKLRADGAGQTSVSESGGMIRIEATATLAEIAHSPITLKSLPAIAQAANSAASPQVRNLASAAGNILQRPRCWYYRHAQTQCLKKGGSQCFAVEGENKFHAIFGDGPCHIVHPSNLAPALMISNAVVHVIGSDRNTIPIADFFHMPDRGVRDENNLRLGEVITHITCEPRPNSGFYAIKEKQSFDWPVATGYVSLELDGAKIKSARICAGAVAPMPWMLPKVEEALKGLSLDDDAALRKACAIASEGAKPMSQNAYKTRLLPVAIRRAALIAGGRKTEVDA